MADLSDDVGGSLSQEVRNLVHDWAREMFRRLLAGGEEERKLGLRLQRWSYDCPHDPYQAIRISGHNTRTEFVKRLKDDGLDVKTYKDFVCVHRSQLNDVMKLAIELGIKNEIKEPQGRSCFTLDCHSAEIAQKVISDLRAAGIEAASSRSNPSLVQVNVFENQIPTVEVIMMEHGCEISDALKSRAAAAREQAREGSDERAEPDEKSEKDEKNRPESPDDGHDEERGDDVPETPEETNFVDATLDTQTPEEEVAARPASRAQLSLIARLYKEGTIPDDELMRFWDAPTLQSAHELLDRYYKPLERDNISQPGREARDSREEQSPLERAVQGRQREGGTKEVATEDRFVEVGMSDRTDYVSSNGQDVVEEHDAEDDRDAARERAAARGSSPISVEEAERENERLETRNESLAETRARLERVAAQRDAADLERTHIPPNPER